MQYTRLGNTGLVVSRLAFGAMTFGQVDDDWRTMAKVDQELANTLIAKSLDAGVNFFDTADAYADGQSEIMLGKALGKHRKDVVIATKAGFRHNDKLISVGLSRRHLIQSAQDSLARLGTDYIDVFIVHRDDPYTPLEETLEALNDLVRSGMVRYVGYSNWTAWKAAKAVGLQKQHNWATFTTAQMYYSLLGRDLEHEVVPFVKDAGIGTMIWSPLVGGFLTGKYTRDNAQSDDSRMTDPGNEFIPFDQEQGYVLVDTLRSMAERYQASVAQLALGWLLKKDYVSTIIIGATKLHHLEDNLNAVNIDLSAEDVHTLDTLTQPTPIYPNWFSAKTADHMWALLQENQ